MTIVERLDSEVVTRDEDLLLFGIPDRKSEYAIESLNAFRAKLAVQIKDRFGVALRAKSIALGLQISAQRRVVVDFAVVDDSEATVGRCHRHVTRLREIANGKSARPQHHCSAIREIRLPYSAVVGSSMRKKVVHSIERCAVTPVDGSDDATHGSTPNGAGSSRNDFGVEFFRATHHLVVVGA